MRAVEVYQGQIQTEKSRGFTIRLGRRDSGGCSLRIYDKTAEMAAKGTMYSPARRVWERNGWDGKSPVWRLEFEFGSKILKQARNHGLPCNTLQGLDLQGLYADAMERTRYVEPITGDLTERWFQLSHAVGDVAPIEHVPRDRQQARVLLLLERIERDLREYRSLDVETKPLRALFEGYFD